jgi:iron complex transport system substrate-binding protein
LDRSRPLLATLLALALGLTACGSAAQSEPAPAANEPGSDADADATRTIEHALGTTEVPSDPQRIVVADRRGTLPTLLDLGVEPVAAYDASALLGQPFHPLISDRAEDAGVEPLPAEDWMVQIEPVAVHEPDLIIGASADIEAIYEQLSGIAPTVAIEFDWEDPLNNVVPIGEAVGRADEAAALVDDFRGAVADAAEGLDGAVGTVSIAGFFAPDDLRIYRAGNVVGRLVEELGGQVVPTEEELPLDPADPLINMVSAEQLSLLSGDKLVTFVNLAEEERQKHAELTASLPTYEQLPAVQAGEVEEVDPQLVFFSAGVAGLREVLDQLATFLAG